MRGYKNLVLYVMVIYITAPMLAFAYNNHVNNKKYPYPLLWGSETNGMQLSIQAEKDNFQVNERIIFTKYIKNNNPFLVTWNEDATFFFIVKDENGNNIPRTRYGERDYLLNTNQFQTSSITNNEINDNTIFIEQLIQSGEIIPYHYTYGKSNGLASLYDITLPGVYLVAAKIYFPRPGKYIQYNQDRIELTSGFIKLTITQPPPDYAKATIHPTHNYSSATQEWGKEISGYQIGIVPDNNLSSDPSLPTTDRPVRLKMYIKNTNQYSVTFEDIDSEFLFTVKDENGNDVPMTRAGKKAMEDYNSRFSLNGYEFKPAVNKPENSLVTLNPGDIESYLSNYLHVEDEYMREMKDYRSVDLYYDMTEDGIYQVSVKRYLPGKGGDILASAQKGGVEVTSNTITVCVGICVPKK